MNLKLILYIGKHCNNLKIKFKLKKNFTQQNIEFLFFYQMLI